SQGENRANSPLIAKNLWNIGYLLSQSNDSRTVWQGGFDLIFTAKARKSPITAQRSRTSSVWYLIHRIRSSIDRNARSSLTRFSPVRAMYEVFSSRGSVRIRFHRAWLRSC